MKHTELAMQSAVIKWARCSSCIHPELDLLHSIPNGQHTTKQNRISLVKSGLLPGVPDLFLPAARGCYHGLYIELKSSSGRLSKPQKEIISKLADNGYKVLVCTEFYDAVSEIESYLKS